MSYKTAQVLRTRVPLTSQAGVQVPPKTRVVVTSVDKHNGKIRAKVQSHRSASAPEEVLRVYASPGAFATTSRGRPKGSEVSAAAPGTSTKHSVQEPVSA